MRCSKCGQDNPEGANFCNACGAPLGRIAPETLSEEEASHLDLLHRYISRPLADKMRELGGRLEGERRHVTVMFADLSGFTAMSETLDPEDVTSVMNACFKELVEVVFKYEGTIDKFIGDEIMALFGAPIAHENDPERAVRGALEMRDRLHDFNATLEVPLPSPLTMHVGINSGEVIAGNVGSDLRMDYSVLGDTVNLAARLEDASESGQIFVSERTYALTRHVFEFRKLRPFRAKGKKRKVQAYEVLGIKERPESGRGLESGYGPLVGREEEMAQLREVVEAVRQGQGHVLGVVGDAGVGKTRLVYELQQMAEDFAVATGACTAYEAPAAYQIFTDAMRGLFGIEPDDGEPSIRQKLQTWAVANWLEGGSMLPHLGSLFGLRDENLLYLPDDEKRQRLKEALLSAFGALTATHPLLLVLEDLHWIDPSSVQLLDGIAGRIGGMRLMICCVYRPEFHHRWEAHPTYRTLAVEPLPPEQTAELSRTLLNLDLPPELEQLIVRRSEGNPFFAEEMIRTLIDEGVIVKSRTGYEVRRDVAEIELPDTIQGVIMARIDRLEAQARETLQYASVIGRRFSQALLQAVSPRTHRVERHLQALQDLELIFELGILPELEYIFKHFVSREVAYSSVLASRRRAIHLEIAKAMEKLYRDRLEDYYEVLAHHFEAGEDWKKAAEYFGKAGARTRELHSDEGANAFFERRDQAVQKVFEQQERVPGWIYPLATGLLIFLLVFFFLGAGFMLFTLFSNAEELGIKTLPQWFFGVFMILTYILISLLFGRALIGTSRARAAVSVTVYTDRLIVRERKGFSQIPFESIASVRWLRRIEQEEYARKPLSWLRKYPFSFRRERTVFGTSSLRTGLRDMYFLSVNKLEITSSDTICLTLESVHCGDLYREVKLSMTKWATAHRMDVIGVFKGSPSRFEDQYHLPLRHADGATLPPATYDSLIEMIEKAEVDGTDEIALREESSREETWMKLEAAGREDPRLWAALHPLRYGMMSKQIGKVVLQVLPLYFLMLCVYSLLTEGDHQSFGVDEIIDAVLWVGSQVVFTMMPMVGLLVAIYLRVGFLEWTKRLSLYRWQRIGLRLLTALPLLALGYVVFFAVFPL